MYMTGSDCRAIRCGKYLAGREQSSVQDERLEISIYASRLARRSPAY